jgi:hypothetical protein
MTEEITVEAVGGGNQPPAEFQEKAKLIKEELTSRIKENREKVKAAAKAAADKGVSLAAAEIVLPSGYQYWNVLTYGPYQDFLEPPYRPSKIIAAGEWATLWALVWINPQNTPDGGYPGTEFFAARDYNAYFETINLTTVADGPDHHMPGQFASPAQEFNWFEWDFLMPDPGDKPNLYEVSFTIDLVDSGLSAAAFNTWHYDPDFEPGLPWIPDISAQWQHDIPARFMVYKKD